MTEIQKAKRYDLEDRTFEFTRRVLQYINGLPKTIGNIEVSKQLVRASGSVGANYIEANDSLGKKDFALHIKICRKEAKESRYWLRLSEPPEEYRPKRDALIQESQELMNIFGAILKKV